MCYKCNCWRVWHNDSWRQYSTGRKTYAYDFSSLESAVKHIQDYKIANAIIYKSVGCSYTGTPEVRLCETPSATA